MKLPATILDGLNNFGDLTFDFLQFTQILGGRYTFKATRTLS